MHRTVFAASALAVFAFAACSSDAPSAPGPEIEVPALDVVAAELDAAATAAEQGGDELAGVPFRAAAEAVRAAGRVSVIELRIDGESRRFLAVGYRVSLAPGVCPLMAPVSLGAQMDCGRLLGRPALVAWERDDPRRVLIVGGPPGAMQFGIHITGGPGMRLGLPATALLLDAANHVWWSTRGTGANTLRATLGACAIEPRLPPGAVATCQRASFAWDLDLGFEPAPLMRPTPNATTKPHVVMPRQSVDGVLLEIQSLPAPPATPSDFLQPRVRIDLANGDATFTLELTNTTSAPLTLSFPTAQEYDFVVREPAGGRVLWVWSATRDFLPEPHEVQLAPGASRTFSAQWASTGVHGPVMVEAVLTSQSHPLRVMTRADLP